MTLLGRVKELLSLAFAVLYPTIDKDQTVAVALMYRRAFVPGACSTITPSFS